VKAAMATHLYAIGEVVSLDFQGENFFSKLNPFTVEAHLPSVGTFLQYRIKSESEIFRRVVPEDKIKPLDFQPDTTRIITGRQHSGEED
jgi:hypothetical protein